MINGYLKEIYINEGDHVKKGQLLFRIDNPQYDQEVLTAKASINSAVANVNSAKIEIDKVKPLLKNRLSVISGYNLLNSHCKQKKRLWNRQKLLLLMQRLI